MTTADKNTHNTECLEEPVCPEPNMTSSGTDGYRASNMAVVDALIAELINQCGKLGVGDGAIDYDITTYLTDMLRVIERHREVRMGSAGHAIRDRVVALRKFLNCAIFLRAPGRASAIARLLQSDSGRALLAANELGDTLQACTARGLSKQQAAIDRRVFLGALELLIGTLKEGIVDIVPEAVKTVKKAAVNLAGAVTTVLSSDSKEALLVGLDMLLLAAEGVTATTLQDVDDPASRPGSAPVAGAGGPGCSAASSPSTTPRTIGTPTSLPPLPSAPRRSTSFTPSSAPLLDVAPLK